FVTGVPLADTGRGSIGRVESWTSDAIFDRLRGDLEGSNNSIITAARPDIMGSIHAMRQANATTCGIHFVVEKNDAARMALNAGKIWLRGGSGTSAYLRTTFQPKCVDDAYRRAPF